MTAYRRLFRWLGHQRWFAALGRRLSPVDRLLYRATGGRLTVTGVQGALYPTLLLTTIGRRSGRERTTPLMYLRDGSSLIVSSENFGQERPAGWPLNLEADPRVNVRIGRKTLTCDARRATEDEVGRYWPRFVQVWPAHESYRRRTGVRHMFVLETE